MNNKYNEETDEKIKGLLMKKTNDSLILKNEIWNQIEKRINEVDAHEEQTVMDDQQISPPYGTEKEEKTKETENQFTDISCRRKGRVNMKTEKRNQSNRRRILSMGTVAATLIFVILVGTAAGHATIEKIKEFFAPEKSIVEEIEGNKEEKNVQLQEREMGYVIYFDETVYILEEIGNKDRILPKEHPADYPSVYMEIAQLVDKDVETLTAEIEKNLEAQYRIVRNEGKVNDPLEAISLYGRGGDQWNDEVVRYYIVSNRSGGSFVIKQQYFYEASEGYGVRLDNMLKDFKIVKLQQ